MITLGKNVCKNIHSELKICVYYNLACAYQGYCWNYLEYGIFKNATNFAKLFHNKFNRI
jgi:hypothetical protein